MPLGYGTNTGALSSSFANASASSSRVTLETKDDKPSLRNHTRNKLLPWSRRGRKSASAEYVKDGPNSDPGFQDTQIFAGRSLSSSPGGSEEALDTHIETLIPTPWPCDDRPENCPSITSVPPYKHSTFYRLHAPTGPPYYINHHLRPPNQSALNAAQSPVSAFSTSFPPLAAIPQGSPPLRTIKLGLAVPPDKQYSSFQVNQSSSESVLPTPDSSTSIGFAGASNVSYQNRDELNSIPLGNLLAAADVDTLDASNPWGQRFHHDSPYDLGQRKGKKPVRTMGGFASVSATDLRARVPSNSRFSRPTTPSPLSQSTPAVNIQSERENTLPAPRRKLSKRKPSGLQAPPTTSATPESESPLDSHRNSPSPVDYGAPETTVSMTTATAISQNPPSQVTDPVAPDLSRKLSKKRPMPFPSTSGYIPPEKNKGPGVFSRMAKRISFGMGNFMSSGKRGMVFERRLGHKGSFSMTDVTVLSNERYNPSRNDSSLAVRDEAPQQEPKRQGPRRVPPPSLEDAAPSSSAPPSQISVEPSITQSALESAPESSTAPQLPNFALDSTSFNILSQFQQNDIRNSLLSTDTEPEWSLGKLTIANPDLAGGSDTDTSLRGKQKNLTPLPRRQERLSLIDPDPRASIRAEVNSRSSLHDSDVRFSHSFSSESITPVQNIQSLLPPAPGRPTPQPPPKERESAATSETVTAQDLRVSMTESSVTPTSTRPSSRVSSPELPPTPQDVSTSSSAPFDGFPPQPPSKTSEKPKIDISISEPQNSYSDASAVSSSSHHHSSSSAEVVTPAKSRLGGRQEHIYIVDVPVDGPLFVRPSPDGTSLPPVDKPELPPLPPKPKAPENITNPPLATPPSVRQSKERKEKETTIFTSLFSTPRSRRTSETSPKEGSPHDRNSQGLSSRPSRQTRNSPDKVSSATVAHSRSPANTSENESRSREERVKSDRDHYASRRGDRRSYLEKRGDSDGDSGNRHHESRSHSQDEDRELRREQERRQAEHEERQAREKAKERERQRLREEEERVTRGRREREDEERRARRTREREEEERRERKAREKEEEQRRLKRAKEKEEEERRLRQAKEREEEERRAREDEERRARRMKEKEEEERRVRREKERIEEEKKARREKEEQERRIRKAKEEEERERERRERRRLEEERRLKKEEDERRSREEARREEERKKRKEDEERRKRKEEEERRRREEEELRRRREEEERKVKREEEERRRRREEEERRRKAEEERRRRDEEERKARREEEERKLREQEETRREEERKARKQQRVERLEAFQKAQEEAERKERERQERTAREEQQRRDRERELIRQRVMEIEEKHQEQSNWLPETRSFYSMLSDRPITSTAGSSYFSNYPTSYVGGYDWEAAENPRPKNRSYDVHDSGRQAQSRREPARLPDVNRRAELGIYSPESSSTYYQRPRAVSLESAPSQPPTPPYKEGSSLRRQRTDGRVYPSVSAEETTFVRPRFPRPVSGIPSPGVFKASEAWEHDRFWRGQSMNFDSGSAVSSSLPQGPWADHHSYTYETSVPSSVSYYPPVPPQGSSYTSYMVQPPAWSYPHYQPTASIEPFSIPPSSNPLPPPPRQSQYHQSHSSS